jgi:hypothetical protein
MKRFCVLFLLLAAFLIPAAAITGENMSPSGDGYVLSDGWIYFRAVSGDDYALCRMREDMTGLEKLSDSRGYDLSVAGDALYFMADGRIRRVGTDGKGEKALAQVDEWASGLITTGDYAYVRSGNSILRYRTDPWKKVGSIRVRKTALDFEIADGWIYLAGSDDTARSSRTFYRVRTDGSERGKWYEAPGPGSLTMWTVSGGRLYYGTQDSSVGTAQLRSVSLDGTGDELALEGLWTLWIRDGWAYGTKFLSEPEITTAEASFDGVETRTHDTSGAFRVNLETGESQYLGDYDVFAMRPVGGIIILEDDDAWSDAPPAVIRADGTAAGSVPRLPG